MENINRFRDVEGQRLSAQRREITQRILHAVGPNSGMHPNVIAKIGSLWIHEVHMRVEIDGLLATTENGRRSGEIANPGAYLLTCIRQACAAHGVLWKSSHQRGRKQA